MGVVLLVFSLVLLVFIFRSLLSVSCRESILLAMTFSSGWVWIVTEILSAAHLLNAGAIVTAWVFFLLLITLLARMSSIKNAIKISVGYAFLPIDWFFLSGAFLIVLATFLLAVFAPPNTWDVLTYHMSRVVHWIQNGTLDPYPTHIMRQVLYAPGFEYFVLHVYALTGSDSFVNLVQWACMVGSAIVVTLIAKDLGASSRGQVYSAVVLFTVPVGILESSSLQGDYMVSFFVCLAFYSLLQILSKKSLLWAIVFGIGSGFAILSKGTGVVFIFPMYIIFIYTLFRERGRLLYLFPGFLIPILMNSPFLLRVKSVSSDGIVSEISRSGDVLNQGFGIGLFFLNFMRHITVHFGSFIDDWNRIFFNGVVFTAACLKLDVNDPRITFSGMKFDILPPTFHEDTSMAGWHVFLIACALLSYGFCYRKTDLSRFYIRCFLGMFISFCLIIKWQPWLSRLQLPFFVFGAAIVGILLQNIQLRLLRNFILVSLLFFSTPYLGRAHPRHLLGKDSVFLVPYEEQYFSSFKFRHANYLRVIDRLSDSSCRAIGLISGEDDWEYPVWTMLRNRIGSNFRLEHVNVIGGYSTISYPLGEFVPCATIKIDSDNISIAFYPEK